MNTTTVIPLQDLDKCALGTANCASVGGLCTNTKGGFTCECVMGFSGDGTQCTGERLRRFLVCVCVFVCGRMRACFTARLVEEHNTIEE